MHTDAAERVSGVEWALRDDRIGLSEPAQALRHGTGRVLAARFELLHCAKQNRMAS